MTTSLARRSFFLGAGGVSTLLLTGLADTAPTTPSGRSGSGSSVANDIRNTIVGLNAEVTLGNGNKAQLINFDNAATVTAHPPLGWLGVFGAGRGGEAPFDGGVWG